MSRTFRLAAAAVAVATLGTSAVAGVATAQWNHQRGHGQREIRNVIYLLGDGMGRTHVTAARERYYGADGRLVMETMPHVGQNRTYSIEPNSGQPGRPDEPRAHARLPGPRLPLPSPARTPRSPAPSCPPPTCASPRPPSAWPPSPT